jgi:integrase
MSAALKSAVFHQLVPGNVATRVEGLPKVKRRADDVDSNCWTQVEARRFLAAAKESGSARDAALFALALDAAMRIGELRGLSWTDVDFAAATVKVHRQLVSPKLQSDGQPVYGPPKGGSGTIPIGPETVALLRTHKKAQASLKLANRPKWDEFNLVFTKENADVFGRADRLGRALAMSTVRTHFERLIKRADVRRITIHGMWHTAASLLLADGETILTVQTRMRHSKPSMTLDIYGHLLPGTGQSAAARLSTLLHG